MGAGGCEEDGEHLWRLRFSKRGKRMNRAKGKSLLEELKAIQQSPNIVNMIGFALEKVHTGILAWLLDTEHDAEIARALAHRLCCYGDSSPSIISEASKIVKVQSWKEHRINRRAVDLFSVLTLNSDTEVHLIFEVKTDGRLTGNNQLKDIRCGHKEEYPKVRGKFFYVRLGSSRFFGEDNKDSAGFVVIDLEDLICLIKTLPDAKYPRLASIIRDWVKALKAEHLRYRIAPDIVNLKAEEVEKLISKTGYRGSMGLFYNVYEHLKGYLEKTSFKSWGIYPGGKNPVLNWFNGWTKAGSEKFAVGWEFNWCKFCLKMDIDPNNTGKGLERTRESNDLIDEIRGFLKGLEPAWVRTIKRPAKRWRTIMKWNMDWSNLELTAKHCVDILATYHPRVREFLKQH